MQKLFDIFEHTSHSVGQVVAFSQKPRFLLPTESQEIIRQFIRDKTYDNKALGLQDNHEVVKYAEA